MNIKDVVIHSLAIVSAMNALSELGKVGLELTPEAEIQSAVCVSVDQPIDTEGCSLVCGGRCCGK